MSKALFFVIGFFFILAVLISPPPTYAEDQVCCPNGGDDFLDSGVCVGFNLPAFAKCNPGVGCHDNVCVGQASADTPPVPEVADPNSSSTNTTAEPIKISNLPTCASLKQDTVEYDPPIIIGAGGGGACPADTDCTNQKIVGAGRTAIVNYECMKLKDKSVNTSCITKDVPLCDSTYTIDDPANGNLKSCSSGADSGHECQPSTHTLCHTSDGTIVCSRPPATSVGSCQRVCADGSEAQQSPDGSWNCAQRSVTCPNYGEPSNKDPNSLTAGFFVCTCKPTCCQTPAVECPAGPNAGKCCTANTDDPLNPKITDRSNSACTPPVDNSQQPCLDPEKCTSAAGVSCHITDGKIAILQNPNEGKDASKPFVYKVAGSDTPIPQAEIGVFTAVGCIPTSPSALVGAILKFAAAAGGGISLLLMIFGAFRIMLSAGNPEAVKKGREQFIAAFIGLLFVLFAVFLVRVLGIDILQLPGLK